MEGHYNATIENPIKFHMIMNSYYNKGSLCKRSKNLRFIYVAVLFCWAL